MREMHAKTNGAACIWEMAQDFIAPTYKKYNGWMGARGARTNL